MQHPDRAVNMLLRHASHRIPTERVAETPKWIHWVCHAISSNSRRQILGQLGAGPMSVNEITSTMRISRRAVSQHLRVLLEAGLVTCETKGNYSYYRLDVAGLNMLRGLVDMLQACSLDEVRAPSDHILTVP